MTKSIYEFEVLDINGKPQALKTYQGKTLLIVNVASKCGFTNQYSDLEKIYLEYKDQGLEILAFPCNQFGAQEPGDAEEIKNFCSLNYSVTFPLFSKVDVNGDNASPVYQYLKESLPGILGSKAIKWNFTKFLVDKNGKPVERYAPTDKPNDILKDIKKIL
ncbi:MAG: glutathione peroxidase [Bacteriovoracaceae bacterium]|nr:glutathione peroxidase [Bacteriovoracaceae bacterium]